MAYPRTVLLRNGIFVLRECVVSILLPKHSHHLYVAQLAVLKAGAAYTCLDPSFPEEHIRFIVEDSWSVAVLTCEEYEKLFDGSEVAQQGRVIDVPKWAQSLEGTTELIECLWSDAMELLEFSLAELG